MINTLPSNVSMPNEKRNFCLFNWDKINRVVARREEALPELADFLQNAKTENRVCEGLYITNRMLDAKVRGVEKLYPVISKFNDTNSPNIQVFLAGIYRKTLIPDAFGPLVKMLLRQTFNPNYKYFDPTEEIGGAILEYLTKYRSEEKHKLYTVA